MILKKRFFLLLLPVFVSAFAPAQTVKVKKEKATVKGETMEGFSVELDGALPEVNKSFLAYLKTAGKVRQLDVITLNEPNLNGFAFSFPLYGVTTENGKTASAWLGYSSAQWPESEAGKMVKELEKFMKEFGVRFYRDRIQVQIDESLRANQTVERQQQRLVNENKSLGMKLENNKREKIRLEKEIEENKLEHEALLKRIEQNKKSQDSVAVALEQVKKMVEMHRERQKKVN